MYLCACVCVCVRVWYVEPALPKHSNQTYLVVATPSVGKLRGQDKDDTPDILSCGDLLMTAQIQWVFSHVLHKWNVPNKCACQRPGGALCCYGLVTWWWMRIAIISLFFLGGGGYHVYDNDDDSSVTQTGCSVRPSGAWVTRLRKRFCPDLSCWWRCGHCCRGPCQTAGRWSCDCAGGVHHHRRALGVWFLYFRLQRFRSAPPTRPGLGLTSRPDHCDRTNSPAHCNIKHVVTNMWKPRGRDRVLWLTTVSPEDWEVWSGHTGMIHNKRPAYQFLPFLKNVFSRFHDPEKQLAIAAWRHPQNDIRLQNEAMLTGKDQNILPEPKRVGSLVPVGSRKALCLPGQKRHNPIELCHRKGFT